MTAAALPAPEFVDRDAAELTTQLIARFETLTGRVLEPAQVERLLLDLIAYESARIRLAIQNAGEQSLVAFARYPMLDYLGEPLGVSRLAAVSARTTLLFTLPSVQGAPVTVPAGTRVASLDARVVFATIEELVIDTGDLVGSVMALAVDAGVVGNGYSAGQIATLVDSIPPITQVANTVVSFEGADDESDETLRARIRLAPTAFSTAGPVNAYRFHALSVSAAVLDVVVSSPAPGAVQVAVLATTGEPSPELLDLVEAALNDQDVRPLTDTVTVVPADSLAYAIAVNITRLTSADAAVVEAAVTAAAEAFAAARRSGLGRDVVRSQLVAALQLAGVYSVAVTNPAVDVAVPADKFADCTGVTITMLAPVEG